MSNEHAANLDSRALRRPLWVHALWVVPLVTTLALSVIFFASPEPNREPVLAGKPIRIGWAPTVETKQLRREVSPLHDYLEEETGRPFPIVVPDSYDALADALVAGETDFAVLPPLLYLKARERDPGVEPLVFKVFDGATKSDGYILVRMASNLNSLADLEGKTFCLTNPSSTTGYVLPRAHIRRHGYNPDEFIGGIHWSREHLQVMRDLLEKKCDAAATYSGALITGQDVGIKTGRLRTLAITGNLPHDVIAAGSHVSRHDRRQVTRALLDFDPRTTLGQPRLGETQRIESFLSATHANYQALEKAVQAERSGVPDNGSVTSNRRRPASSTRYLRAVRELDRRLDGPGRERTILKEVASEYDLSPDRLESAFTCNTIAKLIANKMLAKPIDWPGDCSAFGFN